jgi:MFS family permease
MSKTRNLIASVAAITVLGFAMGLTFPLLSLLLEGRGYSSAMIGLNAAIQPLGTIAAIGATGLLVDLFGARPVAVACAAGTALILLSYAFSYSFLLWCLLRFAQGFLFSVLFAISEAWVVEFADGPYRSRILSLYMSAFAASLALGPVAVAAFGIAGPLPFVVGAAVLLLVTLPIALVRSGSGPEPRRTLSATQFAGANPVLILAVGTFALTEITSLGLLPVYGKLHGLTEERSALLASAFVSGPLLLQYPLGWLADHLSKKTVLLWFCGLAYLGYLSLPIVLASVAIWPLLAFLGAATAGFYTLSLAVLGERYKGSELVTGTAVFSAVYGAGSFFGSSVTGTMMSAAGPEALSLFVAALLVVLFAAAATSKL